MIVKTYLTSGIDLVIGEPVSVDGMGHNGIFIEFVYGYLGVVIGEEYVAAVAGNCFCLVFIVSIVKNNADR